MARYVAALYRDRGLAERVITALEEAGVPHQEISLVLREKAEEDLTARDELDSSEVPFGELAVHSAWERMGWLGGARPAYRDRVPPDVEMAFIAAGPLAIGLGGAQIGATAGGIVGGISNFGFNLDFAKDCYDRILDGQVLVIAKAEGTTADRVRDTMARFRPERIGDTPRPW